MPESTTERMRCGAERGLLGGTLDLHWRAVAGRLVYAHAYLRTVERWRELTAFDTGTRAYLLALLAELEGLAI